MQPRLWLSVVLLLLNSTMSAQTKTVAERLGLPADTKLLILHADDLGVAHSVNAASFDALDKGAISSASIMMPTPWVTEVATYAKQHPNADLGLHLTLTSEWLTYRWGSVESKDKVPSLLDSTGTFPSEVPPVVARAKPAEVERELRAQVERAIALGIRPTHLDSHMGTLFTTPELIATYVKVAHDYRLPFLAMKTTPGGTAMSLSPKDVTVTVKVVGQQRGPKIRIGKYKKRTGYKRHTGFRAALTQIEIESIGGKKKAAAKPKAAPAAAAKPKAAAAAKPKAADVAPETVKEDES